MKSPWSLSIDIAPQLPVGQAVKFRNQQSVLAAIGAYFDREPKATYLVLTIKIVPGAHHNMLQVTNGEGIIFTHNGPPHRASDSGKIFDAAESEGTTYIAIDRGGFFFFIENWADIKSCPKEDIGDYDDLPN